MDVDVELDALGLLCPLPVLRAARQLRGMAPGEVLTVLASDPAAEVDMPHFCAQASHDFLGAEDRGDHRAYRIRRGPDPTD
ncbi:sulfurtransferase TusA family protein [Frigidibacter sp. ROC022]|uniref:sulfurtransferase TusA family protein n=1 Tax=Frigidibacter sp. ROC022 TaxID=2971796 RepID=UPI00215A64C7|nr:sulfurtransferase TusA family protein [Frigidibacter sp. ROC022]MCR8723575.1 sulfurtransferase TusA family protein [Frigidibacter sp. ROC022]